MQQPQIDLSQFSDEQILSFINTKPELKQQYEQFVLQQRKNPTATQSKTKPLTNAEYLKLKDITEYLDSEGGMMIEPTQHYVLKSFDENGEKVFFNVTSHSLIDQPEQKQLVDQQNEEGIRVPMSVGSIKEDHDVKNDICKVIDLVIHPEVAENLAKDVNLRQFFCSLVQSYIFQKYKLKLQDKFIMLKMKYKGKSIQFQRVKGKKPPKVEVIDEKVQKPEEDEDETEKFRKRAREQYEKEILQQTPTVNVPDWELYLLYESGEEQYDGDLDLNRLKCIRFEIQMPLLITGKSIRVKVSQEQFQLTNGRLYSLNLRFPTIVKMDSVKASFILESRTLQILAEPLRVTEVNEEVVEKVQIQVGNVELDNNLIFDIV